MMKINKRMMGWVSVIAGILMFATSCHETLNVDPLDTTPPEITGFTPKVGQIGTMVSITGTHLRDVTTIKIGGVEANVIRVNRTLVMAEITKDNLSGKIEVTSPYGKAVADEDFIIEYLRPKVTEYPSEAGVFAAMVIKGENLDLVNEIAFGTETSVKKANFELQSDEKIEIIVPYYKTDGAVDLIFKYNYGIEPTELVIENAFTLNASAPSVTSVSEKAFIGNTFEIEGTNLQVVEKVLLEGRELAVESVTPTKLVCLVPADCEANESAKVEIVYFDGNMQDVAGNIRLQESPCYVWRSVTLYGPTHPNVNFFSGITGLSYTPCEFEANANKIHLALYPGANGLNLGSLYPKDGGLLDKRWTCNGNQISGANGVPMRFRKLKESNEADPKFIKMINEGTLEYFDAETAAEAGLSYSTKKQVIRHKAEDDTSGGTGGLPYNASNDEGITIGGINLVMVTDKEYKEVLQIGFVRLISVSRTSAADANGTMTLDFYFQKK